jgi:two-component system response regulator CpxR
MPVITLFSGTFCREQTVLDTLASLTGYQLFSDEEVIETATGLSGMPGKKIERAFSGKTSVFNKFTHEKERAASYLKLAAAQELSRDNLIFSGFSSHLIPASINHVLRVCLIADMEFRVSEAVRDGGISSKDAMKLIHGQDEEKATWVHQLHGTRDPWDPSLYDIIIPMDKTSVQDANTLIKENLAKEILQSTPASRQAVEDFLLAARIEAELVSEGHFVGVDAKEGVVTITINKQVLALGKLEEELRSIAVRVEGVQDVRTKVGKNFYQADIYRKFDFEVPTRILLVDDEREFVTTLSERLLMRDMGSVVAYDGRSALDLIESDEPDVMILDLRMPGIDGIEVLRRVKQSNPNIEVIILTGHGSEKDRKRCLDLGAFAYLQKPVDIDLLSETLKKANEKARAARTQA